MFLIIRFKVVHRSASKLQTSLYSVRGLERSEWGGSHSCPGRLWDRFLWQVYTSSKASCLLSFWKTCHKNRSLGSHEIRPIHSAPSLGQSIAPCTCTCHKFFLHSLTRIKCFHLICNTTFHKKRPLSQLPILKLLPQGEHSSGPKKMSKLPSNNRNEICLYFKKWADFGPKWQLFQSTHLE